MDKENNHSNAVSPRGSDARQRGADRAPLSLAVTGGKGGVGKTQTALNLALVLAKQGYRTLVLDGDVDLANVNVMLGVYPGITLEHVVSGERTLNEVLVPVTENLDLLPGASGVPDCLQMRERDRADFLENLAKLERRYDRVIIDTAAGLTSQCLHMVGAAHLAAIVVTPDPTSMTDAFSLVKVLQRKGYRRTPSVIVNMARGATEAQTIFRQFSAAVSRYLGVQLHYLGAIWRDETIAQSITTQRPVAMLSSEDPSCRQFWTLTDMLSVRWSQGVQPASGFARYWARVIGRRQQRQQAQQPQQGRQSRQPQQPQEAPKPEPAPEPSTTEWLNQFRERLSSDKHDPLSQYQLITGVLEALGEGIDEDRVEALQTGLAAMNWDEASNPARRSAAAHFDQLARYIAPPSGTTPEEASALGDSGGSSLDRLLSSIRESD